MASKRMDSFLFKTPSPNTHFLAFKKPEYVINSISIPFAFT